MMLRCSDQSIKLFRPVLLNQPRSHPASVCAGIADYCLTTSAHSPPPPAAQ
jgi:hypothetical protein